MSHLSSHASLRPHRRHVATILSLVIALSAAIACGGDDPPPAASPAEAGAGGAAGSAAGFAGGGGAPVPPGLGPIAGLPDDFCDRLVKKLCADRLACGSVSSFDGARCVADLFQECRGFARNMAKAVARGDATFDAGVFASAVSGPPGELCRRGHVEPPYREMFVGHVQAGERCDRAGIRTYRTISGIYDADPVPLIWDDTCAPGTRCETEEGDCEELRCVREAALGEPCVPYDALCAHGLICRDGLGETATCLPPATVGEACDRSVDCAVEQWPSVYASPNDCVGPEGGVKRCTGGLPNGAACWYVADCPSCQPGDQCVGGACVDKVCADALPLGSACKDQPSACGSRARCIVDKQHPLGACLAPALRGQPCSSDEACAFSLSCRSGVCDKGSAAGVVCTEGSCGEGLFCGGKGCEPRPTVGEPCSPDDDRCDLSGWCDPVTLRCASPGSKPGERCSRDAYLSCEGGLDCGAGNVCKELGWLGDPCQEDSDCGLAASARCAGGICRDGCE